MGRPKADQGEGSAPALTEPVPAEAGASPSERQPKECPKARLMRCFSSRAARLTTGLVMSERSERIGRWSGAVRAAGLFGNAMAERSQASFRLGPLLNPKQRGAHERSEWAAAQGWG